MKYFFGISFFFIVSFEAASQSVLIDSLIYAQTDSVVKAKLINFEKGGVEKQLDLSSIVSDSLINSARKYLGMPHCMGGNGRTSKRKSGKPCIDCSGLLKASFNDIGVKLNIHSAQELARYGKIITDTSQIQQGDLLFFIRSYKSSNPEIVITHAGIYIGDGKMIHASASNGVEIVRTDGEYWGSRFIFATRIF
jgi:murein DD-endopeptidase / murein LD-carboxypeptidase